MRCSSRLRIRWMRTRIPTRNCRCRVRWRPRAAQCARARLDSRRNPAQSHAWRRGCLAGPVPMTEPISRSPNDGWILADPLPMRPCTHRAFLAIIAALIPPEPVLPDIIAQVDDTTRRLLRYMHPMMSMGFCVMLHLLDWAPIWRLRSWRRIRSLDPKPRGETPAPVTAGRTFKRPRTRQRHRLPQQPSQGVKATAIGLRSPPPKSASPHIASQPLRRADPRGHQQRRGHDRRHRHAGRRFASRVPVDHDGVVV